MTTIVIKFDDKEIINNYTIDPQCVKNQPIVHIIKPFFGFYTITLTNLDTNYLHWLIINIPYDNPTSTHGENVIPFKSSKYSNDSGINHYMFTLYKHTNELASREFNLFNRSNFTAV